MKVFVTGEKGFIGSTLIKNFERSGIIIVNHRALKLKNNNINSRFDVLQKENLNQIGGHIDAIIHLASKTSIPNSFINPYETYYTNIIGTLNLLELAREKRIQKFINVSTYVYGKPLYVPIDELHPVNPHSPYNKSKVLAESLCENYSRDFNLDIVTLRPFYVYGPASNPTSFIPLIIEQIRKNGKVILSQKNTKRDFLFIDDFIDLIMRILQDFPPDYHVFNVASGKSSTLEEVVKIIERIMHNKVEIGYNKDIRPNDIVEMVANIDVVTQKFDWKPRIALEEGLRRMIADGQNTRP